MTIQYRRRAVALSVCLAAAAWVTTTAAVAETLPPLPPDEQAGTSAEIGTSTGAPVIECGWALNDTDHNWTDKMDYGLDDSPATKPTPNFPCTAVGDVAVQPDNAKHMIQVTPNAHDEPTLAWVELWGAVTSANPAGTIVYFDVYHPDGTFKVQVDASRYANSTTPDKCTGPAGMFQAAMDNGEMTQQARDKIINECKFQQKSLWYGAFGISKHQPYGEYKIVLHAATAGGAESTLTYYIDVQSFYQLEKDFTKIEFGSVGPNSHYFQTQQGDFLWDGTDSPTNGKSSVRNTGNAGIGLSVRFASLCREESPSCTDDKRIDHFDVKFGTDLANLQSMGNTSLATSLISDLSSTTKPANPGAYYPFDDTQYRVLCPNDIGKIEFSIWTENIPAGKYSAPNGIGLLARPVPKCPTDNGSVYNANGYDNVTPTSNFHHSMG